MRIWEQMKDIGKCILCVAAVIGLFFLLLYICLLFVGGIVMMGGHLTI